MIYNEEELENNCIKYAASLLSGAIKTAPKARGLNSLKTIVLTEKDKDKVAEQMTKYDKPAHAFQRDSKNIKDSDAVILIGMKTLRVGLNCGLCEHENCRENEKNNGLCIFNQVDLGIALGSAVSSGMDLKVDNRIMYTVGYAAKDMNIFEKEYKIIMGIPLKYSNKNIFFDRK